MQKRDDNLLNYKTKIMDYVPMPIEKIIKHMKSQITIWRVQKKIDKANALQKAVVSFEKENQYSIDKLWDEYNTIKFYK